MNRFYKLIACVSPLWFISMEVLAKVKDTPAAPEVDVAGAAIAIGLVCGLVALVRGRRQRD